MPVIRTLSGSAGTSLPAGKYRPTVCVSPARVRSTFRSTPMPPMAGLWIASTLRSPGARAASSASRNAAIAAEGLSHFPSAYSAYGRPTNRTPPQEKAHRLGPMNRSKPPLPNSGSAAWAGVMPFRPAPP